MSHFFMLNSTGHEIYPADKTMTYITCNFTVINGKIQHLMVIKQEMSLSQMCPGPHHNQESGWRRETGLSPPVIYFY